MKKKVNHIELHKHLTQTELLDYTQGVLGNEEMYRLELHLNECELCSDALDGISIVSNPKELLESINAQIKPSKKEASTLNYMAIAASVALVAVLGLSYWLIIKPTQIDTVAINTQEEITPNNSKESPTEQRDEEQIEESIVKIEPQEIEEDVEIKGSSSQIPTAELQPPAKQKSMIRQKEAEQEESLVAIADVSGDMAKEDDTSQLEEVFFEPVEESIAISTESQPVQSSARASKKSKRSIAESTRLEDQKAPEPVGGMTSFRSYINKNLQYPQAAIDNNIKGTVVLEVNINTDGSIATITVTKGLGNGCDAEAMRLVSTGPKWTPKVVNGKPVKSSRLIKIKFKQ